MKEVKYPVAVSASELKKMEIPQIVWIVDRLLPVGVSMIGAPSKYFKSYMALGLCLAVCTGEKFLSFQCNKYACLYLDLESTKRRPKSRLKQIIPNGDWPENFYILTAEDEVSKINEGFTEQIEHQLNQHPDIKLIIVDVFQMIRQPAKRNQSGYDRDYDDFKVLKRIADSHEIALLLIHHTRKMKDPGDVFNELSGSVGVMGALDCAWIITKEDRYSDEGTLNVTGRDMESQKLRTETDAIKEFVEYARAQGSIHADHYYSNCTRLAYKIVGITDKGTAAGSQLDDLSLVEHLIAHTLRTGMAAGRGYKDIYLDCKHRLESMKYLQCTA